MSPAATPIIARRLARMTPVAMPVSARRLACCLGFVLFVLAPSAFAANPAGKGYSFVVSGAFEYEDKAWDMDGWTGDDPLLPIRGADVYVLDAQRNKVLGRGTTASDGSFAVSCRAKGVVDLIARVDSDNRLHKKYAGPFARVRVTNAQNKVYAAFSQVLAGHDPVFDADLGTTTALAMSDGDDEGQPFNVFDVTVSAFEYVASPEVGAAHKRRGLRVVWPDPFGSYAWRRKASVAGEDGYDDAVILHEVGHVVHNLYSDSDNPGGMHFFGDSDQDPRLAFGEGYATFFAGAVLNHFGREALYVDCDGSMQSGGVELRVDLETCAPYDETSEGAADELAVACTLFDLIDDEHAADGTPGIDDDPFTSNVQIVGQTPQHAWWSVFTGPVRKARRLTMNHAWDGWLDAHWTDAQFNELQSAFLGFGMDFWNDEYEPDNARELATPVELSTHPAWANAGWGPEHTLYYSVDGGRTSGTGDSDWFVVQLEAGTVVDVETRYPFGAWDARTQVDPRLTLFAPGGNKAVATDDDSGPGRNASIRNFSVPESGAWAFRVDTSNPTNRYGRYQVRVQSADAP